MNASSIPVISRLMTGSAEANSKLVAGAAADGGADGGAEGGVGEDALLGEAVELAPPQAASARAPATRTAAGRDGKAARWRIGIR
jgi:hypothetical protein